MKDFDYLKDYVEEEALQGFLEISENDVVLKKVLQKSTNLKEFITSLIAAIICIKSRENDIVNKIGGFLRAHPDLENALTTKELRNSTLGTSNDKLHPVGKSN